MVTGQVRYRELGLNDFLSFMVRRRELFHIWYNNFRITWRCSNVLFSYWVSFPPMGLGRNIDIPALNILLCGILLRPSVQGGNVFLLKVNSFSFILDFHQVRNYMFSKYLFLSNVNMKEYLKKKRNMFLISLTEVRWLPVTLTSFSFSVCWETDKWSIYSF